MTVQAVELKSVNRAIRGVNKMIAGAEKGKPVQAKDLASIGDFSNRDYGSPLAMKSRIAEFRQRRGELLVQMAPGKTLPEKVRAHQLRYNAGQLLRSLGSAAAGFAGVIGGMAAGDKTAEIVGNLPGGNGPAAWFGAAVIVGLAASAPFFIGMGALLHSGDQTWEKRQDFLNAAKQGLKSA